MVQTGPKWRKLHAVGDRFAKRSIAYIFMKVIQPHLVMLLHEEINNAVWVLLCIL